VEHAGEHGVRAVDGPKEEVCRIVVEVFPVLLAGEELIWGVLDEVDYLPIIAEKCL